MGVCRSVLVFGRPRCLVRLLLLAFKSSDFILELEDLVLVVLVCLVDIVGLARLEALFEITLVVQVIVKCILLLLLLIAHLLDVL